jgi:hypothetical protein
MHKFTTIEDYDEYLKSTYTWWDKFIMLKSMNWLRWLIYNLPDVPRDTYNEIKYFIQRGKRGYSDRDLWEFDYYLSDVISKGIKDLNKCCHGYSSRLKSMKQWKKVLTEIQWTFEKAKDKASLSKKELERYDKGWQLFKMHFNDLWD